MIVTSQKLTLYPKSCVLGAQKTAYSFFDNDNSCVYFVVSKLCSGSGSREDLLSKRILIPQIGHYIYIQPSILSV